MATYEITVTPLDPYSRTPILTEVVELTDEWISGGWGPQGEAAPTDKEIAIAALSQVDGAECPFDCDNCREE